MLWYLFRSLHVFQLRPGIVRPCRLVRPVTQIPERSLVHQGSLPKLPVPPLKQTFERYLAALGPVVSEEELEHTRQLVEEFLKGGVGERLQRGLERRARKTDNWVDICACILWWTWLKICIISISNGKVHTSILCRLVWLLLCLCSCQNGGCRQPI